MAGCLKRFAGFKVHFHLFRKVFIVCSQSRQAKGEGTQPPVWFCAV